MKLATIRNEQPDGQLVIVSRDLTRMTLVDGAVGTLQQSLDRWSELQPLLVKKSDDLNSGRIDGIAFDVTEALSPLPRAYQWCDGSTYLAHGRRMSAWRNLPFDESHYSAPLMYQGASDAFLTPTEDIPLLDDNWGLDYEAEIAVITERVPIGTSAKDAAHKIALIMLCNDVSLRNLIPPELAKGFGFVQSKPSSAFSPVAITPDELNDDWKDCRVHLPLYSYVNGNLYGQPNAREMSHGFDELIAHAAMTRPLAAGTIIGGGTVANEDLSVGTSCLVERRIIESLREGKISTPFLSDGDRVKIEMHDRYGKSIFGQIDQKVRKIAF